MVFGLLPAENMVFAADESEFPSETNPFAKTLYVEATNTEEPFFDVILPEIEKNIKKNNTHSITPYYDKFPVANNPENFQGLGHTTYADINGKTVTAEAFYRVHNESLSDPNNGMGLLIYQCIQYKRSHPEEDVKITFSSYRTSASASVCVIPESKYYGYMRSLYGTNYDEHGFVRISFMLTEAARMGIEVTMINQLNSYAVNQYDPVAKKLRGRSPLDFEKYFNAALKTECYDKYASGKMVSDFLNFVKVGWKVSDITADMQHVKSATASHYLATDGTEHTNAVFFSSANLDDNSYIGANGNNGSQSGVIVSEHDELYRATYNYTQLMAQYSAQEEIFELRDIVNKANKEQLALIKNGEGYKIPEDEVIVYPGSETDSVFELYFTPFGGAADAWETEYNPICKYIDKVQSSDDYVEFAWNAFGYGNGNIGETMSQKLEDAYCNRPNVNNKFSVRVTGFDTDAIQKLKLGTEIGYRSIKSNSDIHSKDLIMSYSENGVRHNVCLMTSCNFYLIAFSYRTNSMLVINETEGDGTGFYEIFGKKYADSMLTDELTVNPANLVLEPGQVYEAVAENCDTDKLTWSSGSSSVASVINGKISAKKTGTATITVSDGTKKDTIKLTVVDCVDCYSAHGLTCNENEQYILTEKHKSMPLTFEAVFSVDADALTDTTTILGSDGMFDPAMVFSLNKYGQPRVAIRDVADYSKQSVYVFKNVNVATGEKIHLSIVMDFDKKEMYCYVNGVLIETLTGIAAIAPFEEKHLQVIGGDHRNGNATHFTGVIESVAVWSDIRTESEIAADYKDGINTSDEQLLAAYDFTKCPKHFVKDLSSNGNDLKHIVLWQEKEDVEPVGNFEYSFAVIGDTQTICQNDPDAMEAIYDWLLKNKESQKIEYVIGLGDITDDSTDEEWDAATKYISKLDGKIPYVLTRGNHDDWDDFNRNLHNGFYENTVDGMMNSGTVSLTDPNQPGLIPQQQPDGSIIYVTREGDIPEGGDVEGDLTNTYRYFSVQGTDYLIMTLDFAPDEATLKWADSVIEANPDHKVIIVTHAYMYRDGDQISAEDCYPPTYYTGYDDPQNGDDMWQKCFSKHENVVLVLSGHDPWQHIVYRQDVGEKGNTVTQMLIDPQYMDSFIGSTAMVAMFYFSNDGKTLTVRYYSVEKDCYGSEISQFTIGLYTHEHEYKEIITPATLTKDGKTASVCAECAVEESTPIYYPETITVSNDIFVSNGEIQKPSVTVKDTKGNLLSEGTDYNVTYSGESIEAGEYTLTVTFTGKYSGEKSFPYLINKKPEPEVLPGDVNNDGEVTAADARLALRASVGLEKLTEIQLKAADADNDGEVKAADARLILRVSVGLEKLK